MQLPLIKTHLWFKTLLWEKETIFQVKTHPHVAWKNSGSRLELFSCQNKGKIFSVCLMSLWNKLSPSNMGADWCGAFLPFESGLIWFYTKLLSPTCGLCSLRWAITNILNIYTSTLRAERLCLETKRLQLWISTVAACWHVCSKFVCSRLWDHDALLRNTAASSTIRAKILPIEHLRWNEVRLKLCNNNLSH